LIEDGEGPRYIEVAYRDRDGRFHRSKYIELDGLDKWQEVHGDFPALYSSYNRFYTEDPEVGPVFSGFGIDLDEAEKPEKTRKEAIAIISYLKDYYEIPVEGISIAFSGNKGFHIFVNRRVFQVDPDIDLPLIWRKMAEELAKTLGLKTIDFGVYERRRLWRLLNSRHESSELHKIPLTFEELKDKRIDDIRVLATKSRKLPLDRDYKPVPKAVEWFQRTKDQVKRFINERYREIEPDILLRLTREVPCVRERLKQGAKEGQRNQCVWRLATYFKSRGKTLDGTLSVMRDFYDRLETGRDPYSLNELENTVKWVYEAKEYKTVNLCACEFFNEFCDKPSCPLFKPEEQTEGFTGEEVKTAKEILEKKDPLQLIVETVALEHAGDTDLVKFAVVSALSAKLSTVKLNFWTIGSSGKGKSHALNTILKTLPRDYYEVFTSATPKSLFYYVLKYGVDSLKDKLLLIDEVEASEDTLPILRSLTGQTDIEPRHLSVYDAELLDLKIRGKRTVWFTSVQPFGAEQIRNRFLFSNPNETEDQDSIVEELQEKLLCEAEEEKEKREKAFKLTRCMTRLICEETAGLRINYPFKAEWPYRRSRWLKPMFYAIVECSAKIFYKQRDRDEQGRIIAKEEDFSLAKQLWGTFDRLIAFRIPQKVLETFDIITEEKEKMMTFAEISEATGKPTSIAKKHVNQLLGEDLINEDSKPPEKGVGGPWRRAFWKRPQPKVKDIRIVPRVEKGAPLESSAKNEASDKKHVLSKPPLSADETSGAPKNAWVFRHVKPGAPCELCGKHPVEYLITRPDDAVLRHCERCFKELRSGVTKIRFVEDG